jgi:putative ABC transport system permease protein
VKSSVKRLEENYDTYLTTQNVEDFYFSMGEVDVNYLSGSDTIDLCFDLDIGLECAHALSDSDNPLAINNLNIIINNRIQDNPELYESIIDGYVNIFIDRYGYDVEKKRVVNIYENEFYYKFVSSTTRINIPYITDGVLPVEDNEIAIFPEFAEANSIKIGDYYTIENNTYLVTGFFYSPEFLFPIFSMSTITFEEEYQTLVLANEKTVMDLDEHVYTKYIVDGDLSLIFDDFGYDNLISSDLSLLGKNMQMINIIMPKEINFRIISLENEVDNANAFVDIFLTLFIFFIGILLVIFMKRYIDKNKNDINTLHALGYTNFEISKSLMVFPLIVSMFTLIGYLIGLLTSITMFDIYSAKYLFPKADFTLYLDIFVYGVVIPAIVLLMFNYFYIYFTVSRDKQEKYRKHFKIFKFTPAKTVTTTFILFTTISVMIIFGLSSNSMFTAFVDETKLGNNYSEMINLQYMTDETYSSDYQNFTKSLSVVTKVNTIDLDKIYNTVVYGIEPTNQLKLLIENDVTNNELLNEGVIISDYLHTATSITIGDEITFKIGEYETTQLVVGISNELIENNLFMNKELLNSFYGLDNTFYNGLYITDSLYESPYITSRIDYQNSIDEFTSLLNISSLIMGFLVTLSIVLSLYIFSLILITYINDNRINIAILKSIGFNNLEISKKYLLNIYIVLIITFIISIPITNYLLDFLLKILMESIGFKLILEIKSISLFIGFIVLNLIFFVTTIVTTKYFEKVNISEIISHNVK